MKDGGDSREPYRIKIGFAPEIKAAQQRGVAAASVAKPKWMPSHAARAFRNALADKPRAKFEMPNENCATK